MWEQAINFFEKFCKKFEIKEEDDLKDTLSHKYFHTYRVVGKMNEILNAIELPKRTKELAKVVALFHDLGRFNQLEKCKAYDDEKTHFDHGQESVNILKEEKWFTNKDITKKEEDAILFAIENHNKYKINESNDELSRLLAKLVRDADKLAIIWEALKQIEPMPDKISKDVLKAFTKHHSILWRDVQNPIDELVYYMAFVYDLNFPISTEILKKEKLLDKCFDIIEKNESKKMRELLEKELNIFWKEEISC